MEIYHECSDSFFPGRRCTNVIYQSRLELHHYEDVRSVGGVFRVSRAVAAAHHVLPAVHAAEAHGQGGRMPRYRLGLLRWTRFQVHAKVVTSAFLAE